MKFSYLSCLEGIPCGRLFLLVLVRVYDIFPSSSASTVVRGIIKFPKKKARYINVRQSSKRGARGQGIRTSVVRTASAVHAMLETGEPSTTRRLSRAFLPPLARGSSLCHHTWETDIWSVLLGGRASGTFGNRSKIEGPSEAQPPETLLLCASAGPLSR